MAGISRILDAPDPNSAATGTTMPMPQGTSVGPNPSAPATGQGGQTQPKPYGVGQDGTLQLDPGAAPLRLLAAAHDGVISQDQLSQHLPTAGQAQLALDQADQHATTNPGLSGQLEAFRGLLNPSTYTGLANGQGMPRPVDQAKVVGDAIQHSTDNLVDPGLKDAAGAKTGGFIGGAVPSVAAGFTGPEVLLPTLFSSGYQSQYEDAKAKLAETAQQQGQTLDPGCGPRASRFRGHHLSALRRGRHPSWDHRPPGGQQRAPGLRRCSQPARRTGRHSRAGSRR